VELRLKVDDVRKIIRAFPRPRATISVLSHCNFFCMVASGNTASNGTCSVGAGDYCCILSALLACINLSLQMSFIHLILAIPKAPPATSLGYNTPPHCNHLYQSGVSHRLEELGDLPRPHASLCIVNGHRGDCCPNVSRHPQQPSVPDCQSSWESE